LPPTTEILIFEASNEFRDDPLRLSIPPFDIVLKADGVHAPAYYGKQVEDPSIWGNVFLNWDSYEAHKAVTDAPSYQAILDALKPSLGGKTEMYHVQFSAPTIALEKPVTEVLILTLKAPENRATVVDILSKISEVTEKRLVFGQTREDENKYILIGGWPTVEAHWETVAKPEIAATLDKLYSLAAKDHHYHTKLSQYRL
jgi:quinol monooxygenase YgiN